MAYTHVIMPCPEEGWAIDPKTTFFAYSLSDIQKQIKNVSAANPQATIVVYALVEMHRQKTAPTYQKYVVKDGEIVIA
jgi:hypothetical protein